MRNTIVEAKLRPYDDGSGHREEVKATWLRDASGDDVVAHVEITQGNDRLVVMFKDWPGLREAIDSSIKDTKWFPETE